MRRNMKPDAEIHLSEDEIIEIRSALYDLGQLIFDDWLENGAVSKYPVGVLQRLREANRIKVCKSRGIEQE
jgi:hypothetical protein